MPGVSTRLMFPEDIQDPTQGHWMSIVAVGNNAGNASTGTVTLFVPGGINGANMIWAQEHDYTDAKLSKIGPSALSSLPGIGGALGTAFGAMQTAGAMAGGAINPKVEVLFRNTSLRTFIFNLILAPQSASEADSMKAILRTLRGWAAPKLVNATNDPQGGYVGNAAAQAEFLTTGGIYLTPAEFLIKFYCYDETRNNTLIENTNIPRIGRCVMERIDVNYMPQSEWSTFKDGTPLSVQLEMVFKEMRIIDQDNILNDATSPTGGY